MNPSETPAFTCLTCDLVRSRGHADRARVQDRLEEALGRINEELGGQIAVRFSVTLGDEWQGLLSSPSSALEADFRFRRALHPLPVASGIGVGPVWTPARERTALMDGPCFHRAREALELAKQKRGDATVLRSGDPVLDDAVDGLCLALHAIASRWTEKQFRSLSAYLDHGTEIAAANSLGVTQPTLHQSLDRSLAKAYLEARGLLLRFAGSFPIRIADGAKAGSRT